MIALIEQEVPGVGGADHDRPKPVPGRVEFDDAPLRALVGELPKTPLAEGIRAERGALSGPARGRGILTRQGFEAATRSA